MDGGEIVIAEPELGERAGLEVLQHDVGARGERAHDPLAFGVREVDGDRALAAVDGEEIAGVAGFAAEVVLEERRAPSAGVVAGTGALYLDHVGAEVGQDLARPGSRHDAAEVEHADMRQGSGHVRTLRADDQAERSLSASAIQAPP